ncbi:MAG TPA: hypothetical protein PLO51_04175, partial [Candidatus Micrarchaeota archaeon]|nr:hypothetical protein [Candidatus Micrarchaeota archaeon]
MPVTGSFGGIALDVCNNIGSFQTGFAPWQVNIGLALLISTIFIALTYMFANLFRNPQIIAWAKFELFQALVTALIAVGVVAFIGASCAFPPTIFSSTGAAAGAPNMYVAAQNYLSWLRVTTVASFGATFLVNSVIVRATGITWNMRPTGVGFSTQPFAVLMPISGSVNIMINGVMLAFMIIV